MEPQTGWVIKNISVFSHRFGDWEVEDQGFGIWWQPFAVSSHVKEQKSNSVSSHGGIAKDSEGTPASSCYNDI